MSRDPFDILRTLAGDPTPTEADVSHTWARLQAAIVKEQTRTSRRRLVPVAVAAALLVAVVAGLLAAAIASSASSILPAGDGAARDACNAIIGTAQEYGSIQQVATAEAATAAQIADWQENRHPDAVTGIRSSFRDLPATDQVTVCAFRGEFATPTGPPRVDGQSNPRHNLLVLLVDSEGTVTFDSAGYEGTITAMTPGLWRQGR
jgi:hypothetical protein